MYQLEDWHSHICEAINKIVPYILFAPPHNIKLNMQILYYILFHLLILVCIQ